MKDARTLAAALERRAREEGFALVGITGVNGSEHTAFYRRWIEAGRHGEMGYLARPDALRRRADLRETMRAARKPIAVWGAADLDLNVDALRRRSRIERVFTPAKQGQCAFISGSAQEQAATLARELRALHLI